MDKRSKPYFFSFDTKAKPGKIIAHCIRVETMEINGAGFDQTSFTLLGADYEKDDRLRTMMKCCHSFIKNNHLEDGQ